MNTIIQFTRTSPFTGVEHTKDIDVGDMDRYLAWANGEGMIQNMLPGVSAEDREFIKTGITPEEWDDTCPPANKKPYWRA